MTELENLATILGIVDQDGGLFRAVQPVQSHGKGFGQNVQNPLLVSIVGISRKAF